MTRIDNATPEQWAEIERLKQRWIADQAILYDDDTIRTTLRDMLSRTHPGREWPVVLVADSPLSALLASRLYSQLRSQLSVYSTYCAASLGDVTADYESRGWEVDNG